LLNCVSMYLCCQFGGSKNYEQSKFATENEMLKET